MQLCAPLPAQLRAVCRLVAFTPRHISSFHSSSRCHRPREGPVADAKGRRGMAELMRMEKEEEEQAIPDAPLLWNAPLQVIKYPDPRLRAGNATITRFDDTLRAFAKDMFDAMYDDEGVGLAAPQVGVNIRLMVFNEMGKRGEGEEVVLVNPEIISYGKTQDLFEEGCLSFPELYGNVERPTKVTIRAHDEFGKRFKLTLSGWPARIFQHEYDHLQGTLLPDRMQPEVRENIAAGLEALVREFQATNPGTSPAL
ncbi:PDF1B [Auxenochlorella protothecoides x Auxenochlorella symbiontica]